MRKPLEGVFVVELTTYWSATTTARFMRAMGARVVRIETPPRGDACRYYGRIFGMPITNEENAIHDQFNGGKECISLDLNKPENIVIVHNMLAQADVFITSTRYSGLKKLGLDWDTLKEKYPKLVMGHVTGYGKEGPLTGRPGIDAISFFAANGIVLDTRTDPDSPPIYPTGGMGDTTTGMALLCGVLAALYNVQFTGKGDYVMASLYGTGNWVTTGFATGCNYGYKWPREAKTMSPMGQGYRCKDDKYVYVFLNEYDKFWPAFVKAFSLEDIKDDPRYSTQDATLNPQYRRELVTLVQERALLKNSKDIQDVLTANDVPSCILNQYKDRFEGEFLEQSVKNGYMAPHTYPSGKTVYLSQMPIYFDSQGVQDLYERHRAIGEDNEALIKEFSK
jgi:crotonobetainyl-CoA:carnitine CoA-transferase CaiB-like acyl-CoA transferase